MRALRREEYFIEEVSFSPTRPRACECGFISCSPFHYYLSFDRCLVIDQEKIVRPFGDRGAAYSLRQSTYMAYRIVLIVGGALLGLLAIANLIWPFIFYGENIPMTVVVFASLLVAGVTMLLSLALARSGTRVEDCNLHSEAPNHQALPPWKQYLMILQLVAGLAVMLPLTLSLIRQHADAHRLRPDLALLWLFIFAALVAGQLQWRRKR
jgi:hypothetical protein